MFYIAIIKREIKLAYRSSLVHIIILFTSLLSILMFSTDIVNNSNFLPIILWVCTTFIFQSAMNNLFENDYQNGTLEQLLMQERSLECIIFLKIFTHWMCLCLPTNAISVLIIWSTFNNINYALYMGILLSITSLVMSFISSVGAGLIIGKNGGIMLAQIITIPVMLPVLVYFNILSENINNYIPVNDLILFSELIFSLVPISTFFTTISVKLTIESH